MIVVMIVLLYIFNNYMNFRFLDFFIGLNVLLLVFLKFFLFLLVFHEFIISLNMVIFDGFFLLSFEVFISWGTLLMWIAVFLSVDRYIFLLEVTHWYFVFIIINNLQ